MKFIIAALVILGYLQVSSAEETLTEKAKATTNTAKRKVTKAVNRTGEALCGKLTGDSKIQCMAKEAKNHASEAGAAIQDKASELKNSVDSDKK
ncbi:MAG: hypothetical protein V4654_02910 [Bdellovibrionota bacterium]